MKRRSEEVSLCNNNPVFCMEAFTTTKVSGLLPWAKNWLVEQKNSALLRQLQSIFYGFVRIFFPKVAGWLFYMRRSIPRQTDCREPSHSHFLVNFLEVFILGERPSTITGLGQWTGLVNWTGGLTLKIIIMFSNDTHSPMRLCGSNAALFLATHMVPEQITHYHTVFMRVFVPSVYNGFLLYDVVSTIESFSS